MAYNKSSLLEDLTKDVNLAHQKGKEYYYILPAIFRKSTAEYYSKHIHQILQTGLDGFVVKNYEALSFLSKIVTKEYPDIKIVLDHNMYTYNDYAKTEFAKYQICRDTIPLELNKKEILGRNNRNSEMIIYGYYPLMTTAGCVHKNTKSCNKVSGITYLKDRYKTHFPVKNNCNDCYNVIYNSVPVVLFKEKEELMSHGIDHFRFSFTIETKEETNSIFDLFEGKGKEIAYTKGHYKRGVE
jgi:putative protease